MQIQSLREALDELINRKRQLDAGRAKEAAEKVRRETEGLDPLLIRLSEQNAELTEEVNAMAEQLNALDREQEQAGKLAKRIAADYKDAQATLESSGLTEGLGRVLLEQRESLPDIQPFRYKGRVREQHIAGIGVRWLRHQAEARRIADLGQTVSALGAELTARKTPQLRNKLQDLVEQRQTLLGQAMEADQFYLGQLRELDAVERELLAAASAYDELLVEYLLWLRSADATRLEDLLGLPEEVRRLLSVAAGAGMVDAFIDQVVSGLVFWLALLVAAVLLWKRRTLIAAIEETGKRVGKPTTDRFADTLRACVLTLLAAAPLSLLRWLRVIRRRMAYEAVLGRRQVARAARQAGEPASGDDEGGASQLEEPEVDLEELNEDSRVLVKFAVLFTGFVGLYLIWSSLLPALRIFEDVALWYHTVTVEGEDKRLPITLADLGLALIYAIGLGILAKRLPALLEIILLRRFDLSSGSRYTITTLVNYAIVATGVVLVLNTIGAQWSQLQWLVAALGVGIGFGLQEIVANFISGLIILFERPIRIGDFVTVGDTDGAVTKIRIRATTIRNWDGKELLVPNKEFITGRPDFFAALDMSQRKT